MLKIILYHTDFFLEDTFRKLLEKLNTVWICFYAFSVLEYTIQSNTLAYHQSSIHFVPNQHPRNIIIICFCKYCTALSKNGVRTNAPGQIPSGQMPHFLIHPVNAPRLYVLRSNALPLVRDTSCVMSFICRGIALILLIKQKLTT